MRFLLAAVLLVPALARAEDRAPDAHKMTTDDCARARKLGKTCVLEMGSETIEGGVTKPEGEVIDVNKWSRSASLIRIRRDFIVEILKSAEDL